MNRERNKGITQEELIARFEYVDGLLLHRVKPRAKKNRLAGTQLPSGYKQIKLNGKFYYTHKLIYLYHHGIMPDMVTHIDGDVSNNQIDNLADITDTQVAHRRNSKKNNKLGYIGVTVSRKQYSTIWQKKAIAHYDREIDAATHYDRVCYAERGPGCRLNFPEYYEGAVGGGRKDTNQFTSQYRGVIRNKMYRCFFEGKYKGAFDTPEEAARRYDKTAHETYGQLANLNFPEDYKDVSN